MIYKIIDKPVPQAKTTNSIDHVVTALHCSMEPMYQSVTIDYIKFIHIRCSRLYYVDIFNQSILHMGYNFTYTIVLTN